MTEIPTLTDAVVEPAEEVTLTDEVSTAEAMQNMADAADKFFTAVTGSPVGSPHKPRRRRPLKGATPRKGRMVCMDDERYEAVKAIGGGSLTAGVDELWQIAKDGGFV